MQITFDPMNPSDVALVQALLKDLATSIPTIPPIVPPVDPTATPVDPTANV